MNLYQEEEKSRDLSGRLYVMAGIVFFFFFLIIVRLWYLQIIKSDDLKELSENNRIRLVKIIAPRGIVYDFNGNRLVENRPGFNLTITREDLKDLDMLKITLPKMVDILSEDIDKSLKEGRTLPPYRTIKLKRDLDWEEVARLESFKTDLPGIGLEVSPRRLYPHNGLASHLIGYVGEIEEQQLKRYTATNYRAGDIVGKYGIEESWEKYLRGIDGGKQIEVDALGREIAQLKKINPIPGNNLFLTIDLHTQNTAKKLMKDKAGAVVALNPQNGKVIAMVSSPTFDPNIFATVLTRDDWEELLKDPFDVLTNRAIQGQYPPASTFKIITAIALLEEEIISPSTEIFSGPDFKFAGMTYRDWKDEGHGIINVHRAIVESSDTFFYQTGLMLGVDKLAYYAKGFGFGKKTNIELKGEMAGLVPTKEWKSRTYKEPWYKGETISVSVGQGFMLATPLQMVNAYSAIANGGRLYLPQIVDRVETPSGEVIWRFMPKEIGRPPVSRRTIDIIRSALKGVVNDAGGTARGIRIKGIDIAGKTGTAQVIRLDKEKDKSVEIPYKFKDHSWFIGYAPADYPQIAVAVLVEHGGFGAQVAAPIAREVIRAYLRVGEHEDPYNILKADNQYF
jgi:penicillin-binding protein 2